MHSDGLRVSLFDLQVPNNISSKRAQQVYMRRVFIFELYNARISFQDVVKRLMHYLGLRHDFRLSKLTLSGISSRKTTSSKGSLAD